MSVKQVLQVNVRLSEGGAAGVAANLADELERLEVASPFAYGYGPGAQVSPVHDEARHLRITPLPIAAVNRAAYSYLGAETSLIYPPAKQKLFQLIRNSDVVHLHVIHSYFISTESLFDLLIKAGKPVLWTLHDQWAMTGRCAQPRNCDRWKAGCQRCPDLQAYPPAKIDRAETNWPRRRAQIARLQERLPSAIVPCADWLGDEAERAGLQNIHVIKNSVDRPFWDALQDFTPNAAGSRCARNLFICRDLRDRAKVDWNLLTSISQIPDQMLTVIGDNAPNALPGVTHLPAVNDRRGLAQTMKGHDRLIFMSEVDYYPLTIAEALTAGMNVFAIDSKAAREFVSNPRLRLFQTKASLLSSLAAETNHFREAGARETDGFFAPTRMTADYLRLYNQLNVQKL